MCATPPNSRSAKLIWLSLKRDFYILDIYIPTDFKTKITLDGFNPDWVKAYRQYSKDKIKNS